VDSRNGKCGEVEERSQVLFAKTGLPHVIKECHGGKFRNIPLQKVFAIAITFWSAILLIKHLECRKCITWEGS